VLREQIDALAAGSPSGSTTPLADHDVLKLTYRTSSTSRAGDAAACTSDEA